MHLILTVRKFVYILIPILFPLLMRNIIVVSWKNPAGEIFSEQEEINIFSGGTYELTITDTIIGCSSTDEIFINENFFPPRFSYTKDREYLPCEGNLEISMARWFWRSSYKLWRSVYDYSSRYIYSKCSEL